MKKQGLAPDPLFNEVRRSQEIRFTCSTLADDMEVTLKLPDLSEFRYSVWGDWGPMYTVHVGSQAELQFTYRYLGGGPTSTRMVKPEVIEFNSPMLADERNQYPLYLGLADQAKGIKFHFYFNPNGKVGRVLGYRLPSGQPSQHEELMNLRLSSLPFG